MEGKNVEISRVVGLHIEDHTRAVESEDSCIEGES